MGIHVPTILERLLDATADKTRADARITGLRSILAEEAGRRYAEEGAAPTWKRRDVGTVRYDEPGEWSAVVVDEAAFGSYVAEHYPTEATGVLDVPAAQLEAALDALRFAGIDVIESRVAVRGNFTATYLERLAVDVEETRDDEDGSIDRTITVVDASTGQLVPGTSAERSAAKLVVTLDRDLKARVIEEAKAAAAADLAEPVTRDEALAGEEAAAPELTPAERATVDRFESAPDAVVADNIESLRKALGADTPAGHRNPYVGDGADGARRSAQIDREEADGLDRDDPRYDEVLASAARWDEQARELEAAEAATAPPPAEEGRAAQLAGVTPLRPERGEDLPDGLGPHGNATTATLGEALAMQDPAIAGVDALEAMDNRENLRRIARAKGIPAGGTTKRELAERLYAAGVRA